MIKFSILVKQMKSDMRCRESLLDLAAGYGYYLGRFQEYKNFNIISEKSCDKATRELIGIYFDERKKLK